MRLGTPDVDFDSWKTWQRGAPELGVEIARPNERAWGEKLADSDEAGFLEVVRFDAEAAPGARLRVWDRVDGDLVERAVERDRAASSVLGGAWVVAPIPGYDVALRLEGPDGALLPSPGRPPWRVSPRSRPSSLEGRAASRARPRAWPRRARRTRPRA